jgi:tripartite-type tricarboxylate transporter receptor subunit TctC
VDLLYQAFEKVYSDPDFQADCATVGYAPSGMNADEISSYLTTFGDMAKNTFSLQ